MAPTTNTLPSKLHAHLSQTYTVTIVSITSIQDTVFRVDISHPTAEKWIARVFPPIYSLPSLQTDVALLEFLATSHPDFPAERLARPRPLSTLSPDGHHVLVTLFIEGEKPKPGPVFYHIGKLLGRLSKIQPDEQSIIKLARNTGAIHYAATGGIPSEVQASLDWLVSIRHIPVNEPATTLIRTITTSVSSLNTLSHLPQSLIHPDPLLHNTILTFQTNPTPTLIDWTNVGFGPRILPLAFLIFASCHKKGPPFFSSRRVDAIVAGYRSEVPELTEEELDPGILRDAMLVHRWSFCAFRVKWMVDNGKEVTGKEWWVVDEGVVRGMVERMREAFAVEWRVLMKRLKGGADDDG
ncbi:hypothetical protein HDV00_009566 [Rhizophlyctis rosea]|nr:hypothetical protein HDV00_009566 [Rhizophlyctis rosea]